MWPAEYLPVQLSPFPPCTEQELALLLLHEMVEVSPTWTSEGDALRVAESAGAMTQEPEAQPRLQVCMVDPVQLLTRLLPWQTGGVPHCPWRTHCVPLLDVAARAGGEPHPWHRSRPAPCM